MFTKKFTRQLWYIVYIYIGIQVFNQSSSWRRNVKLYSLTIVSHLFFRCNESMASVFPKCAVTPGYDFNSTHIIYPDDILDNAGITLPLVYYLVPVFLILIVLRIVGYLFLRYRRPHIL